MPRRTHWKRPRWNPLDSFEFNRPIATVTGLNLVYYGIVLLLLSMISFVAVFVFPPIIIFTIVGVIAGYLMLLAGPLFCLAVPSETGAKGLIIGAVGLQVIGIVLTVLQRSMANRLPITTAALGNLAAFLSSILFVMFMRKLASYIGRARPAIEGVLCDPARLFRLSHFRRVVRQRESARTIRVPVDHTCGIVLVCLRHVRQPDQFASSGASGRRRAEIRAQLSPTKGRRMRSP